MSDSLKTRRIGYLISRYPAISHAFILREVLQLRNAGMQVETASINPPDLAAENMPADEHAETARTYYVKRDGLRGALMAHACALLNQPLAWLSGLFYVFALSGTDPRTMLRGMAYFTEALMIGRWMQRHALSHLHVHFATAAANVGLYVKKIFGFSLSLTVHGPDEFDNVHNQWLPEKITAADFLFCIGYFARSQVMRLSDPVHWHKFDIAPLGVDTQHYRPTAIARVAGPLRILCVGRLTPAKGQHILLQAAILLRDAGRDFRICLVGAGPDAASLQSAVHQADLENYVEFTGALNQTEVHALYAQADVFALPSFAEGIPVVLMEAMACGIPCVSSRITGIPELIRTEHEGLLLTPSDAMALAQALSTLMDDAPLRLRMGQAARARIEANFHLGHNIDHLSQLFRRHLENSSC